MATYEVPFRKTVYATVQFEASSFEDAYEQACAYQLPCVANVNLSDEDSWEVEYENIEGVD